jgi:hypothetical protein
LGGRRRHCLPSMPEKQMVVGEFAPTRFDFHDVADAARFYDRTSRGKSSADEPD